MVKYKISREVLLNLLEADVRENQKVWGVTTPEEALHQLLLNEELEEIKD